MLIISGAPPNFFANFYLGETGNIKGLGAEKLGMGGGSCVFQSAHLPNFSLPEYHRGETARRQGFASGISSGPASAP
jgi:hypothetical protein